MSAPPVPRPMPPVLPCHAGDPDLWFADAPADLERAKTLCVGCPVRRQCLAAALERAEPWGVWGGEIFERGSIVGHKRPRGRPRKEVRPRKCNGRRIFRETASVVALSGTRA